MGEGAKDSQIIFSQSFSFAFPPPNYYIPPINPS